MLKSNDVSYDAVVIGTGLGGSTFAYGLARRGLSVAIVERGDFLKLSSPNLAPVHVNTFRHLSVIGGFTKGFGAAMYRLREMDFEPTEMESGVSPGWPIRYSDLEPYYGEGERLFKVHGSSEGDATDPPRSTPWPYPAIPHQGGVVELVERLTERAGIAVARIPRSIDYDPANGGTCVLCRHCDGYYCPRDAKIDAEIGGVRAAMRTGHATVLTNTDCLRVLTSTDGRKVIGVRVRRGSDEFTIHAPVVSISCGLRGTPLLLWRSRTSQHPKGLANGSGALGRHWAAHTQAWVFAISVGAQRKPFHQKTFAINEFYKSAPGWDYPTGVIQAAGYIEPIGMGRRYRYLAQALLAHSFHTFAMNEAIPTKDTGFALTDDGAVEIGRPVQNPQSFAKLRRHAKELFRAAGYVAFSPEFVETDWHSVGTARMGADPATSVINDRCEAHDVRGLYVLDASALPTAGALNSGLTIVAVALRAAAHVN